MLLRRVLWISWISLKDLESTAILSVIWDSRMLGPSPVSCGISICLGRDGCLGHHNAAKWLGHPWAMAMWHLRTRIAWEWTITANQQRSWIILKSNKGPILQYLASNGISINGDDETYLPWDTHRVRHMCDWRQRARTCWSCSSSCSSQMFQD